MSRWKLEILVYEILTIMLTGTFGWFIIEAARRRPVGLLDVLAIFLFILYFAINLHRQVSRRVKDREQRIEFLRETIMLSAEVQHERRLVLEMARGKQTPTL